MLKTILKKPAVRVPVLISLGAIAGALSRYYLGQSFTHWLGADFPYGTFVINVTGCFAMGCVAALAMAQPIAIHPELRLFLATGFLGSYTTFSTYELESAKLLQQQLSVGLLYWLGSAVLGLVGLELGIELTKRLLRRRLNSSIGSSNGEAD